MKSETSGMLAISTVADLPLRDHARVPADAPLSAVVDEMKAHGRGCVLVVDKARALVGIFTERDLISRVDHADAGWRARPVESIMTPKPMVIRRNDSLAEALRRLTQHHRRHLPIVDDRGEVLGVMSIRDVLAYIASRVPDEMMNLPPDPAHDS